VAIIQRQAQLALSTTWIFPRITDTTRQLSYPRETFTRICRDARIQNLRMHDLRRTFATRATGNQRYRHGFPFTESPFTHCHPPLCISQCSGLQSVVSQVVDSFK
jgi:integrase